MPSSILHPPSSPGLSPELSAIATANSARLVAAWRPWFFIVPPPHRPSDWLAQNITLHTSGTAGKKMPWSWRGRHYLEEIVNQIDNPSCRKISHCAGTGSGKTLADTGILLHEGYFNPFPGLFVMPGLKGSGGAIALCRDLTQTLDASPVFKTRLPTGSARKTGMCSARLQFGGNDWDFVGAHSPNQLAGKRCRIVVIGESDKNRTALGREAGANQLASERTKGMANTKEKRGSTPSLEGHGIWQDLLGEGPNSGSDCRRRFLTCHSCGNGNNQRRNRVLPRERTLEILRKHGCANKIDQAMAWQEEA